MQPCVQAKDPGYEKRVRDSFGQQQAMRLIGATLGHLGPGTARIDLPFRSDLTQQDGFLHAGIVSTIADSAGGYAGLSLMPADSRVLTTEFKLHLLAPARGERFTATGTVVKAGRTLTICELRVVATDGGKDTLVAYGTQTLMCIPGPA